MRLGRPRFRSYTTSENTRTQDFDPDGRPIQSGFGNQYSQFPPPSCQVSVTAGGCVPRDLPRLATRTLRTLPRSTVAGEPGRWVCSIPCVDHGFLHCDHSPRLARSAQGFHPYGHILSITSTTAHPSHQSSTTIGLKAHVFDDT